MFSLNYVSPKSGRAVKKEKIRSLDNNLSLASVSRMHVASNSVLDCSCQSYSSLLSPCPGPITKPHFMAKGGWGRLHVVAKLLLIPPLNIYHSTIPPPLPPPPPRSWGHDSWHAHPQPHQSGDVFITATFHRHRFCLIQMLERGRRRGRRRVADREEEMDGKGEN